MKFRSFKLGKTALTLSIFLGLIIMSTMAFSDTSSLDSGLDNSEVTVDEPFTSDTSSDDPDLDDSELPVEPIDSLTEESKSPEDGDAYKARGGVYSNPQAVTASQAGSASFTYPIEVPPGRNGLQPDISLRYSSYNGNGWLGVGWDLSMGSISRSTRYGLDYTADDYVVDGSDLVKMKSLVIAEPIILISTEATSPAI